MATAFNKLCLLVATTSLVGAGVLHYKRTVPPKLDLTPGITLYQSRRVATRQDVMALNSLLKEKKIIEAKTLADQIVFPKWIPMIGSVTKVFRGDDKMIEDLKKAGVKECDYGKSPSHGACFNTGKYDRITLFHKYDLGKHEPIIPFNPNEAETCTPGGIYFTTEEHVENFIDFGSKLAQVILEIDDSTQIVVESGKIRSNKVTVVSIDHPKIVQDLTQFGIDPMIYLRAIRNDDRRALNDNFKMDVLTKADLPNYRFDSYTNHEKSKMYVTLIEDLYLNKNPIVKKFLRDALNSKANYGDPKYMFEHTHLEKIVK
jgi:hypothetical protein